MTDTTPSPSPPEVATDSRSFPLFTLPLEIRLEIYSHCAAYSLLNLYNTNLTIRAELNDHPAIITSSYGYIPRRTSPAAPAAPAAPASTPTTSTPFSQNPTPRFTITNIDAVDSPQEAALFKTQQMHGDQLRGRRVMCEDCWSVGKCVGYRGSVSLEGEGEGRWFPDWCTCCVYRLSRAPLPRLEVLRGEGRVLRSDGVGREGGGGGGGGGGEVSGGGGLMVGYGSMVGLWFEAPSSIEGRD
ncbi:hypothetical protein BJ508DRAFT_363890 [Ascobolus immersus RN42]|uniref:F-box domain-containing protein n=1 Tax=Ascobolus immersus RN42 TaxID=1160509 RepID=A0A3N4I2K8_ASCIM|nr:hypothetical protein BJ508DRAFT_363890 [Ascobolus immersus RN42]